MAPQTGGPAPAPRIVHQTSHLDATWILLPAGALVLLAGAAWMWSVLTGQPGPGWAAAAAGAMVALLLLFWWLFTVLERAIEGRRIARVLDRAVAHWPQYASEAQWRAVVERDDRRSWTVSDLAWPIGIVTVLAAAGAVWAAVAGAVEAVPALVAGWLLVSGLVVGRNLAEDRRRRTVRRRRERLFPYPSCHLSPAGYYHEDVGVVMLDKVTDVRLVPPGEVPGIRKRLRRAQGRAEVDVDLDPFDTRLARSGWSLLQFTIDPTVERTFWHTLGWWFRDRTYRDITERLSVRHVRVPPGFEAEARWVVEEVTRRLPDAGPAQSGTRR